MSTAPSRVGTPPLLHTTNLFSLACNQNWGNFQLRLSTLPRSAASGELQSGNRFGGTTLYYAIGWGCSVELARIMIDVARNDNLASIVALHDRLPLHAAADCGSACEMIKLLVKENPLALTSVCRKPSFATPAVLSELRRGADDARSTLLRRATAAVASKEYSVLASLVDGDEKNLARKCLSPEQIMSETSRFATLLCVKKLVSVSWEQQTANKPRSQKKQRKAARIIDMRKAAWALPQDCWSHVVTFL
jgi:hypothetical protein